MSYLAVKKVKGRFYAYRQESYREGGKVRTRTIEYLGAIDPGLAGNVKSGDVLDLAKDDEGILVPSLEANDAATVLKHGLKQEAERPLSVAAEKNAPASYMADGDEPHSQPLNAAINNAAIDPSDLAQQPRAN